MKTTAQNYHLTHGPALRDRLAKQQDQLEKKAAADRRAALMASARKAGFAIPSKAKPSDDRYGSDNAWSCGNVTVSIRVAGDKRERIGKGDEPQDRIWRRKRALCDNLNTVGANKFGAFVKAKYGPKADAETIKRAHEEWLDLLSACTC